MMTIKIILEDDEITTRINGTLEEIAMYYFPRKDVIRIEILDGGIYENELFKKTPLEIYRASKQDIEEFDLICNIRLYYSVQYKQGQAANYTSNCGLCKIA